MTSENQGGHGPYDPEIYQEMDLGELSDEDIWNVVSFTEDDMSDDEWRQLFADKAATG